MICTICLCDEGVFYIAGVGQMDVEICLLGLRAQLVWGSTGQRGVQRFLEHGMHNSAGATVNRPISIPTETARIALAGGLINTGFRAMQDDVAVTVVDWQVVHAWRPGDPDFVGALTIINDRGTQLATARWSDPTDEAADQSLTEVGWRRTGPWEPDWLGRRSAPVRPASAIAQQEISQDGA